MRVVESKVMPGLPSVVASPDLRRDGAYGTEGVLVWCLNPSKKCSARAPGDAGDGKKKSGSCAGIGVTPVQGRPRERTGEGTAVDAVDGW